METIWSWHGLVAASPLAIARSARRREMPHSSLSLLPLASEPDFVGLPPTTLCDCHRGLGITWMRWPLGLTSFLTRTVILSHGSERGVWRSGEEVGVTRVRSERRGHDKWLPLGGEQAPLVSVWNTLCFRRWGEQEAEASGWSSAFGWG